MTPALGAPEPSHPASTRAWRRKSRLRSRRRRGTATVAALVATSLTMLGIAALPSSAALGPVGNGFTVTAGDLSFILKQIKIAERHSTTYDSTHVCSTMLNNTVAPGDGIPDAEQVPDIITS